MDPSDAIFEAVFQIFRANWIRSWKFWMVVAGFICIGIAFAASLGATATISLSVAGVVLAAGPIAAQAKRNPDC